MKFFKRALAVLTAMALLSFCGCRMGERRVLIVGTSADLYPFTYYNDYGIPTGFDVKLINRLAESMGVSKVEFVTMKYNELMDALSVGKIDCIVSAMSANDDRRQSIAFTEPYYTSTQTVLVRADGDYKELASLERLSKLEVSVVEDTLADDLISAISKESNVVRRSSAYFAVNEVINNRCDAAILETVSALYYVENYSTYLTAINSELFEKKAYAIAVQPHNTELLDALNSALETVKSDGTLQQLVEENLVK